MRALIISVLLYMVLAPPTEGASVAHAEASVAVNDTNPPAEPLDGAHETPLTQSLGECPFGWYGHQARCYHFVNQANTWIEAQEYCIGLDANLASARNPREYKFLQDMVHQLGGSPSVWLAGFYLQTKWMWVDGEGFYYTNWGSLNTASSNPCIYLRSTGGWSKFWFIMKE
ncbi:hypothetical protein AAFF_G00415890 [Aldrovandia affinis]|uniref:C-type lectin domain-containing protein n=1 Tax=Aldrovandia affinis TaxID=143900 RepID=A0AAD7WJQ8_9TELE|nr:hypothetical protein AAFF_G00415890 [Aldrovandia affinis]